MTYTLHHLAPGSYDLALDGVIMGGVVREITARGTLTGWCAELLEDLPAATRPRPFDHVEHRFLTLEAAAAWLGGAQILKALEDGWVLGFGDRPSRPAPDPSQTLGRSVWRQLGGGWPTSR